MRAPQKQPAPLNCQTVEPQWALLDLSRLSVPALRADKASPPLEKERGKAPETAPTGGCWAGEGPTNRELAKERWYTRAAWTAIAMNYLTAAYLTLEVSPVASARSQAFGFLLDTLFVLGALKNSEVRRFTIEGSVLANPIYGEPIVQLLTRVMIGLYAFGGCANVLTVIGHLTLNNTQGAMICGIMGVGQLHLAAAWLRRNRFYREYGS